MALAEEIQGEVLYDVPMAEHTSFRVGGPVDYLVYPVDLTDLQKILRWCGKERVDYFVLGRGSNLLVRDGGIRGLAISLSRGFIRIEELHPERGKGALFAEAGESLGKLVEFTCGRGWAGLEFAAGIPGSIGGAISMNAGAFKGEMKDVLRSVRLMDTSGNVLEKSRVDLLFSYRSLKLPQREIILGGEFQLAPEGKEEVRSRMEEIIRRRAARHPHDLPSAGSIFQNPPQGPAGKLIEEVGLKGTRSGDAQISEKHANIIVNTGNARSSDVLELMEIVKAAVLEQRGIRLEPEIKIIGEDS